MGAAPYGGLASGNLESMRMNDIPRIIVARPRAVPIPLPLIALGPTRLNLIPHPCQLQAHYSLEWFSHIGAFCNMSGTIKKRTMLPRMYTWSSCETRPSRPVTVMSFKEMFRLSSAARWREVNQSGRESIALVIWACLLPIFHDKVDPSSIQLW